MTVAGCLVVLPTFNESLNIGSLIKHILKTSPSLEVLVVDDSSPDGTAEIVRNLMIDEPKIRLLVRPQKLGLGSAYLAGFKEALQRGFSAVCTMDADRSHDPSCLPIMIKKLQEDGADIVIGSRYVPGGSISGWNAARKANSHLANALVRRILKLPARDCTSGFRVYSEAILKRMSLSHLTSNGYSMLVELLYESQVVGARIIEVPICFRNRTQGKSKLNSGEILNSLITYSKLGAQKYYISLGKTRRAIFPR